MATFANSITPGVVPYASSAQPYGFLGDAGNIVAYASPSEVPLDNYSVYNTLVTVPENIST